MMKFMARYGWYIFLIPLLIFLLDDYETDWHHHGHERLLYILLENGVENAAVLVGYLASRWWRDRAMRHIHAECPKCHHRWVMHPKQKIPFCPRCGAPEPP